MPDTDEHPAPCARGCGHDVDEHDEHGRCCGRGPAIIGRFAQSAGADCPCGWS